MNNLAVIQQLETKAKGYRDRANKAAQDKAVKLGQIEQLDKQEADLIIKIKADGLDPNQLPSEEQRLTNEVNAKFTALDTMVPDEFGNFPQPVQQSVTEDHYVDHTQSVIDNIPE